MRRATVFPDCQPWGYRISIHALLAESDTLPGSAIVTPSLNFYPRSPCGERRNVCGHARHGTNISIHALLAESDGNVCGHARHGTNISIHALLAESDVRGLGVKDIFMVFLSTLSLRRATVAVVGGAVGVEISIHALLAESDAFRPQAPCSFADFYPRSPCGERLRSSVVMLHLKRFLSTLSLRRATCSAGSSGPLR